MQESPKISFIISYNADTNLNDCLEKLLNQSFSDIEVICVNTNCEKNPSEIIEKYAPKDERIKLITAPLIENFEEARKLGLGIANGEFIYFLNGNDVLSENFVQNICREMGAFDELNIKENYLYRRIFLENNKEINGLIQNKVDKETKKISEFFETQKQEIKDEFEKFYCSNTETIKNNAYEVITRCNQLEKLFYEKDAEYKSYLQNSNNDFISKYEEQRVDLKNDISKVYDYINSELNKKGAEINNVYEEITRNYNYTEKLVTEKNQEMSEVQQNEREPVLKKLQELEKEIIVRYVNIKRLLDTQIDEVNEKLNQVCPQSNIEDETKVSADRILTENIDKIYAQLNKTSAVFYEELSKIYKDFNQKLIEKNLEEKNNLEQRISELRNEFDFKLQELRSEMKK